MVGFYLIFGILFSLSAPQEDVPYLIPEAALMKTLDPSTGVYVFKPEYIADSTEEIIDCIEKTANASSTRGGAIFVKSGTYVLTRTLTLRGSGVQLIGLRDPETGEYPTFRYGDELIDTDYDPQSDNPVLNHPAVIRLKGASYDSMAEMKSAKNN